MDTKTLINNIDNMTKKMYKLDYWVYKELDENMEAIQQHYVNFITAIPKLREEGIDIDSEVILQQLRNLAAAIEKKDTVLLFDTLQFEVKPLLEIYQEVEKMGYEYKTGIL